MKLKQIKRITGTIEVITGLHIGGSSDTMEISGNDNPIIRSPANSMPYIPGSSLRGKMRSLAEWHFGEVPRAGSVLNADRNCRTAKVFGVSADKKKGRGPTRLIVRDAPISDEWLCKFRSGTPITEMKSENSINRITAMANPRPMERVVPGVTFDCEIIYRVFDMDDNGQEDETLFDEIVLTALALLEADAIGGGASRGNGKIALHLKIDGNPLSLPELSFAETAG